MMKVGEEEEEHCYKNNQLPRATILTSDNGELVDNVNYKNPGPRKQVGLHPVFVFKSQKGYNTTRPRDSLVWKVTKSNCKRRLMIHQSDTRSSFAHVGPREP
jgi:hypothetical protein